MVHVVEDVSAACLQRGVAIPLHLGKSILYRLCQSSVNIVPSGVRIVSIVRTWVPVRKDPFLPKNGIPVG